MHRLPTPTMHRSVIPSGQKPTAHPLQRTTGGRTSPNVFLQVNIRGAPCMFDFRIEVPQFSPRRVRFIPATLRMKDPNPLRLFPRARDQVSNEVILIIVHTACPTPPAVRRHRTPIIHKPRRHLRPHQFQHRHSSLSHQPTQPTNKATRKLRCGVALRIRGRACQSTPFSCAMLGFQHNRSRTRGFQSHRRTRNDSHSSP